MIQGLHSIVLFCRDTEASRRWYEAVGFSYLHGYEGMHWFGLGGGSVMLHPVDEAPQVGEQAMHAAVDDVDALFAKVRAAGLEPYDHTGRKGPMGEPVDRPWGVREFELNDPDGYRWAFTQVL